MQILDSTGGVFLLCPLNGPKSYTMTKKGLSPFMQIYLVSYQCMKCYQYPQSTLDVCTHTWTDGQTD